MSNPEKLDESFVIAIKLATMRYCMLQTNETKAFRLITENVLKIFTKIMVGDKKNIHTLEEDIKNLFSNIDLLITSKTHRILEFIDKLRKLEQDVTDYTKDIGNIQQRWEESNNKLQEFKLNSFSNALHKNEKIKVDKFQQDLLIDFKVYDELLEFENKMQIRSKDIINVIIKSNPKTEIEGLTNVLLNDDP